MGIPVKDRKSTQPCWPVPIERGSPVSVECVWSSEITGEDLITEGMPDGGCHIQLLRSE
jgi:hypothetical protein